MVAFSHRVLTHLSMVDVEFLVFLFELPDINFFRVWRSVRLLLTNSLHNPHFTSVMSHSIT